MSRIIESITKKVQSIKLRAFFVPDVYSATGRPTGQLSACSPRVPGGRRWRQSCRRIFRSPAFLRHL